MKVSASILSLCATLSPEANQIFNPINITFQAAGVTSGMRRLHGNTKIMSRVSVNHIRGEDASVTVQFNLTVYCDALTALLLLANPLVRVQQKVRLPHNDTIISRRVMCASSKGLEFNSYLFNSSFINNKGPVTFNYIKLTDDKNDNKSMDTKDRM